MPITILIRCHDCGAQHETTRRNTKYCTRCRLLRDLHYLGDRTRDCWICEARFAPLDPKDKACADCTYEPKKFGEAECVYCHETRLRARKGVDVCHTCIRAPSNRGKLIRGLRMSQESRRARPAAEDALAEEAAA